MVKVKFLLKVVTILAVFAVILISCEKNHPPNIPSNPSPSNGETNIPTALTLAWSGGDPDGDAVTYTLFFGTASNSPQKDSGLTAPSYSLSSLLRNTTYYWKVRAEDEHGVLTEGPVWNFKIFPNRPPNTPPTPYGPSSGRVGTSYSFSSSVVTDPDGDSVAIQFDWGDGTTSNWSSFVSSGSSDSMSHSYSTAGTYQIIAKAKDTKEAESGWSSEHSITISGGGAGWQKTFGGSGEDVGYFVRQTSDGGYIIVGETFSYGAGAGDVWLIKTDAAGNKLWDKTWGGGGSEEDVGYSVQQTQDGGYIITGGTYSNNNGDEDAWLIKTDAAGNKLWDKTFGDSSEDFGCSVQQTSDGGYIIAGGTYSYGAGAQDVWLIKTDAAGNKLWDKTFGGSSLDGAFSVQQTYDGGYIITGGTYSYGAGAGDAWLIKTDAAGNKLWDKTFGGGSTDWAYSCQQTSDGGYIIGGITRSYSARFDVWLIKTDAAGNKLWDKTFDKGNTYDGAYSVQQTSDGGYIIAGFTYPSSGIWDAWLIKTDASGNKLWDKTFGGSSSDGAYSVQQTSDGGYIIAGDTYSYGAGGDDVWLIKTDASGNASMSSLRSNPFPGIGRRESLKIMRR